MVKQIWDKSDWCDKCNIGEKLYNDVYHSSIKKINNAITKYVMWIFRYD